MKPNHRNTDPPTSALAGGEIESSGLARMHRGMCLQTVLETPGLTAREIEDRTGIKAHKRLPELREAGFIANGPTRACRVSGRQAMTWLPSHHQPHQTGGQECL